MTEIHDGDEDDRPLTPLDAMLYALDRIFADSQTRANRSKELTVDEAHKEFFGKDDK